MCHRGFGSDTRVRLIIRPRTLSAQLEPLWLGFCTSHWVRRHIWLLPFFLDLELPSFSCPAFAFSGGCLGRYSLWRVVLRSANFSHGFYEVGNSSLSCLDPGGCSVIGSVQGCCRTLSVRSGRSSP